MIKIFLGICVGMQYLFEKSDENLESNGLGFFKGIVKNLLIQKNIHYTKYRKKCFK